MSKASPEMGEVFGLRPGLAVDRTNQTVDPTRPVVITARKDPKGAVCVDYADSDRPSWRFSVNTSDLVPPTPKWSDVEAFDKVTFRIRHLDPVGDETRMAYDVDGTPNVLGVSTRSLLIEEIWELLSIEKPKPQPPTTPGSHVTVPHPYWESGINHLFLLDSGKWVSQTGQPWLPAEDVASKDFTVIHDAGAK